MKRILLFLFAIFGLLSCNQYVSREFGGTTVINLKPGERLVEVTWKESNLWYLVEEMDSDYVPKTKVFKESSTFGTLNGKVIFNESR